MCVHALATYTRQFTYVYCTAWRTDVIAERVCVYVVQIDSVYDDATVRMCFTSYSHAFVHTRTHTHACIHTRVCVIACSPGASDRDRLYINFVNINIIKRMYTGHGLSGTQRQFQHVHQNVCVHNCVSHVPCRAMP